VRFFEVLDFQHMVLAIFLGLVAALVIYMGFRGDRYRRMGSDVAEPHEGEPDVAEKLGAGSNPIPPILIFLYAGFIVWCIVYAIYFGLKRGPL